MSSLTYNSTGSPLSYQGQAPPAYTPGPYTSHYRRAVPGADGLSRRIDKRKLQTRPCQYLVRDVPCPFEERCAFSHDKAMVLLASKDTSGSFSSPSYATLHTSTEPQSPLTDGTTACDDFGANKQMLSYSKYSSHGSDSPVGEFCESLEDGTSEDGSAFAVSPGAARTARSAALTPPPPSYEQTLRMHGDQEAPPAYPTPSKYRHDPYSFTGIVYVS